MTSAASFFVPRSMGAEEAAVFETFVVPRYLSVFGEDLIEMLAPGPDARVCHVDCRTGYPDHQLLGPLPNAHVYGCDASPHAVRLAQAKAAALDDGPESAVVFDYQQAVDLPLPYPSAAFSHAFTVHPPLERRAALIPELARILAPLGQAVVATPLRGSFVEIADLLRECALKHECVALTNAVDAVSQQRPTVESLETEFESAGFGYVEVRSRTWKLTFATGRQLFEDPVTRMFVMPEFPLASASESAARGLDPLGYVRDAIDKYWRGRSFELTVNVGVVSGRKAA